MKQATNVTKEVVKGIESLTYRDSIWRVFEDFVYMTWATLERMPENLIAIAKTGSPVDDPPEIQEKWEAFRAKYKQEEFSTMARLVSLIINHDPSGGDGNPDVLGEAYMHLNLGKHYSGQYFTPWPVCKLMASLTDGEIDRLTTLVDDAVFSALRDESVPSEVAQSLRALTLRSALGLTPMSAKEATHGLYRQCAPWIATHAKEHIKVLDPACGSSRMLMARAALVPSWLNHWGLIQYYGQDIDWLCVMMSKVNMMMAGLNGYGVKLRRASLMAMREMPPGPPESTEEHIQLALI